MKITGSLLPITKITARGDFRIDFGRIDALIGLPQPRLLSTMSADPQQPPVPLAEISQGPSAFEMFLDRNQKNLIILAILLVLATAAFVVYRGIEQGRQKSAGAALIGAADIASLESIVTDHENTQAAFSAKILLADKQWQEGKRDSAIETLRKFIDSNPKHPALPTASAGLASKLMAQGKAAEATEIFQSLVDDPKARFIAPYALISLGDIAQSAGDTDRAELSYNRVKTDFADSNFVDLATRRISNLKAKAPVEIDPPPAPEPAPGTPDSPGTPGDPGFQIQPVPDFGTPPDQPANPDAPAGEPTQPAEPSTEPATGTAEPAAGQPAQETTPAIRIETPPDAPQDQPSQEEPAQEPVAEPTQEQETESNP